MADLSRDEFLDILETTTAGALRALRNLRPSSSKRGRPRAEKGKSNIAIVEDLLRSAPGPLHIEEIVRQARSRFGRTLSRESLVSALTKKVLDRHTFTRVGPNTFALLEREDAP